MESMSSNLDRYLDLYNSVGYDLSEIKESIENIEDRYNDKEITFQCLMRLANERIERTLPMFQMLEVDYYGAEAVRLYPVAVVDAMMNCVVSMMKLTAEAELIYKAIGKYIDESNQKEREAATYLWVVVDKNKKGLERIFWQIESLIPEKGSIGSTESIDNISSNI